MNPSVADTIAAIASPPGPALRGIIRISGPNLEPVLSRLIPAQPWQSAAVSSPQTRSYSIELPLAGGHLQLPARLLHWPTGRSFTGEPLAELHLTGSPPLLNEVLEQVFAAGARSAERGEFTLRAFLAGRIDLVQAEAVLGVIDAGNETELKTALAQLAGGISSPMAELQEQLLLHLADLEAGLDFVEEDIEFVSRDELHHRLVAAESVIARLTDQSQRRMQSHSRARVVLAGLPNAGKSTLFNRLAGRVAALVSPIAGTTRDYLSVSLAEHGINADLVDTAGWELARNPIEEVAGQLREDQFQRAQLIVWCTAADLGPDEREHDHALRARCRTLGWPLLEVASKADRTIPLAETLVNDAATVSVSAEQGKGIAELIAAIKAGLSTSARDCEMIATTAARCNESLHLARQGIQQALHSLHNGAGDEIISLDLREVLEQLGRIVGRMDTEDILDRIFSRFCIGK